MNNTPDVTNLTPDVNPSLNHREPPKVPIVELQEQIRSPRELYGEASDREREIREAGKQREKVIAEMQQTGELLDRDHKMYEIVDEIAYRLRPGTRAQVHLSLSDGLKAFALQDKQTVVISAGIISELGEFLNTRGRKLTEDHLALIIAHEMSHWDEEAKKIHINETYCDVNGFFMVDMAKFNSDAVVESLEFLEYMDEKEKAQLPKDREGKSVGLGEITHPSSINRRVLIQMIANDPDLHLEGRYVSETRLDETILGDFESKAKGWQQKAESRFFITSEQDIEKVFSEASSTSQVLEAFLGADEYHHALMSKEFAKTPEFGNLVLAIAVYGETIEHDFKALNKDDFAAQVRAGKIQSDYSDKVIRRQVNTTEGLNFEPSFPDGKEKMTTETKKLIQNVLESKFPDPLKILAADQETLRRDYPEFADLNFNHFYTGLLDRINFFIRPKNEFAQAAIPNMKRAGVLGLTGEIRDSDYLVSDSQQMDTDVADRRGKLLEQFKVGLASSLIEISQLASIRESSWSTRHFEDFGIDLSESVIAVQGLLPYYSELYEKMVESLLKSGACKTREVAMELSLMMRKCGRYQERYLTGLRDDKRKQLLIAKNAGVEEFWQDTDETNQDLRDSIFNAHFALTQGGRALGEMFGSPREGRFIDSVNYYFAGMVDNQDYLKGSILDPYSIVISGGPSINIPYTDSMIDHTSRARGSHFKTTSILFDPEWNAKSIGSQHNLQCNTTDEAIITSLMLDSVEDRHKIVDAVLANNSIIKNTQLLEAILDKGVSTHSLTQDEIKRILDHT